MKTKSKEFRYIIYRSVMIGLCCGVAFLLSSCEKDWTGDGTGEPVAIRLSASVESYGATRSYDTGKAETAVIPLGEGLYLHARLEADELRAITPGQTLTNGQKLLLSAYPPSGTPGVTEPVATAQYYYSATGNGIVPDPITGPLLLEAGNYIFAVYSYNSTTACPSPAKILTGTELSGKDLLWGSVTQTISQSNREISINMSHKCMQVRPRIKTGDISSTPPATIEAISGVQITGKSAEFTVLDGTLAAGSGDATPISIPASDWPNPLSVTQMTGSHYYPVAPADVKVSVGSITVKIDGVNQVFTNLVTSFYQTLSPGMSYTLTMDLRKTIWAGSNIYWDGSKLTFKPAGYVGEGNYYQGVFFKWGSLVGISPALTAGAANGGLEFDAALTPIYVPNYTPPSTAGWAATTADAGGKNWTWATIPYTDDSYVGTNTDPSNTYLMDAARNTDVLYAGRKGDICQYIGKTSGDPALQGYRMPTASEFGTVGSYIANLPDVGFEFATTEEWIWEGETAEMASLVNHAGTFPIYAALRGVGMGVIFPSSAERATDGSIDGWEISQTTFNWSGSVSTATVAYALCGWTWDTIEVGSGMDRRFGVNVRCVKK